MILYLLFAGFSGVLIGFLLACLLSSSGRADLETACILKVKEKDDEIKSLNIIISEYIETVDALITEKGEYCRDFLKYKKLYDQTFLQLDALRASLVRENKSVGYKMTPTEKVNNNN